MKNTATKPETCGRNPELGAIAIVVAAMWMTLFGLAAFAVDVGYGYTNKRGLKAVADAAVRAGMKTYAASDQSSGARNTATTAAQAVASANGYTSGVTVNYPSGPNRLQVDITMTQPTFFLKLFGFATKPISARSAGQIMPGGNALLLALGGCGSYGLKLSSNAASTFNGNVWSNGPLDFDNGPTPATVLGSVQSACAGYPHMFGAPVVSLLPNVVSGTVGSVGTAFTNPLAGVIVGNFVCTSGDLITPSDPVPIAGGGPGGEDLYPPGVYCSGGNMAIADAGTMRIYAANATFVAMGQIVLGANTSATLSPALVGTQGNVVLYSASNTPCGAGQAINIGFNNFDITGSVYAPNGCIRVGGGAMTLNGSMVGYEIHMGPDTAPKLPWNFNNGGGGPSSWQMYE